MNNSNGNTKNRRRSYVSSYILMTTRWENASSGTIRLGKERESTNSRNRQKLNRNRRKTNKEVTMRTNKKRKRRNQTKAKMNLRMRMKSLILLSSKTITRISKESERYANMTKKLKNTQKRRATSKSKEIKSTPRSKTSRLHCLQLRNNWKSIKRRNSWRSIKSMSVCQSASHRYSIMWKSTISWDFKKTSPMPSYLPDTPSIGLEKGSQNWRGKPLISARKKLTWRRNWLSLFSRSKRLPILSKSRGNSMRKNNY